MKIVDRARNDDNFPGFPEWLRRCGETRLAYLVEDPLRPNVPSACYPQRAIKRFGTEAEIRAILYAWDRWREASWEMLMTEIA